MKTLLQINSSLFSEQGQSSQLAQQFVKGWQEAHPGGNVVIRDLAAEPIPHLDAARFGAFIAKAEDRTAEQRAVAAFSDALIDELRAADIVVLGVPLYNFAIPSTLKAYFDHVARAGVTFKYTASGSVGLLSGKKVYVFATRGGLYAGSPNDTQTAWLQTMLGFIGLGDIEFVYAEGLAMGEESQKTGLENARQAVLQLVQPLKSAA